MGHLDAAFMSIIRFFASVIAGAILGAVVGAAILGQDAWQYAPAGRNWFGTREDHIRFSIVAGGFYGVIFGAFVVLIVQLLGLGKLGGAAFGAAVGLTITVSLVVIGANSRETLLCILSILGLSLVGLVVAFLAHALRKPEPFR